MYADRVSSRHHPHAQQPSKASHSETHATTSEVWLDSIAAAQRRLGALLEEADAVQVRSDADTAAAASQHRHQPQELPKRASSHADSTSDGVATRMSDEEEWMLGELQASLARGAPPEVKPVEATARYAMLQPDRGGLMSPTPLERVALDD
jgi:hypothetical protein